MLFRSVERLRCAAERSRRRDTIRKVGERGLHDELCLRARIEYVGSDEQFERTESASPGEVADRTTVRALADQRGERRRRIAGRKRSTRDLQRLGECGVPFTERLKSASAFSSLMSMMMVPSFVIWGVTSSWRLASTKATVMAPPWAPPCWVG